MNKRDLLAGITLALSAFAAYSQPAIPEIGYRWVIDGATSDEFEDKELDENKWYNADPKSWRGRAPGLFEREAVSMADGKLCLTVDLLEKPVELHGQTFTHRGAHVYSKATLMPGSYVECSMKANKTFMSSTFWLITTTKDRVGCDRRTTELDIQECIGFPEDNHTISRMGSNTHSRSIPEGCNIPAGSVGNNAQIGKKVYEDYHTYAVWWKSPTELLFYLNGEYKYTITPKAPFDLPLGVKLVCETYDWSKAPADGGMTGSKADRTTSYEWVRCYNSVPVDQQQKSAERKLNKIFDESVAFTSEPASLSANELAFQVNYTTPKDTKIKLMLKDDNGKVVSDAKVSAYAGKGNVEIALDNKKVTKGTYTVVAELKGESSSYKVTVL